MSGVDGILAIPAVNGEERVRVFRRALTGLEGFEGMEVDAYVVLTKRYLVVFDTLLCPEDMAIVMHEVQDALAGRQLLVVNSHADWDHTWGNAYFTAQHPAPIIARSVWNRKKRKLNYRITNTATPSSRTSRWLLQRLPSPQS
jgi:glyoxylase-like metal-dependent hydrolase (beta-lactamase superfamily II)